MEAVAPRREPTSASEPAAEPLDTRAVVARYEQLVYGIAATHTHCRADADDVYQDVFLAYHRRQPTFRSEEHRKAWLITTTLNCARHLAGTSWRTRVVPLNPDHNEPIVDQFEFRTVEQNSLFAALQAIPQSYRTVLHLFYFEDLTISMIADVLDLSLPAVKMRLSRGRALMREQLTGGLFDD